MTVPEASRLAWLESRDISERAVWVSQFREGNEPLGQVVQSIFEKRGAHWDTPIQHMVPQSYAAHQQQQQPRQQQQQHQQHPRSTSQRPNSSPQEATTPPRRQTQGQQQHPSSPGSSSKPRLGATADTLRDGKTLCSDFNNNKCATKGPSCDKGLHKCSKVLRGGRPCGMSYHGAYNCRNV